MKRFGGDAVRFDIPAGIDRRALHDALAKTFSDVVLTETIGLVIAAPDADLGVIDAAIASARGAITRGASHTIEVVYDGEDLDALALSRHDVIRLHTAPEYEVAMMGFMPGFAYLRGGAPELDVARRAPRVRVPAGSVAIAAGYTGIYPFPSPGGWNLLGGAASFRPFDANGAKLALGDRVRFAEAKGRVTVPPSRPISHATGPCVEILESWNSILVDGGRIGRMHEGVPHGGPLVPSACARANEAVGNRPGACAIEVHASIELAIGGTRFVVKRGDARVAYVAVPGGFAVDEVLGSRTTLLSAALGGFHGRILKRGDRVPLASANVTTIGSARGDESWPREPITVVPGPDPFPPGLFETELTIDSASDRTGTRITGLVTDLASDVLRRPSVPMIHGAIELTPRGLIVLGPDHPVTGGYPVIGLITGAERDRFFSIPLNTKIRLRPPT